MGKKIYVGNLSFNIETNQLNDVFAQFGTVASVNIITDRDSGRSKGFGFVEMAESSEAQTAIENLNGTDLGGRPMKISEAKPQEPRSNGGSFRNSRRY